jgi:hypothetical protein
MCAWSDPNLSGMVISVNEAKTTAGLARVMRKLRRSVE